MEAPSSTDSKDAADSTSGGVMQLNVSGYVMAFPSGVLLRDGLRDTCLAVLLHRFGDWMHKDAERTIFIDADPLYFVWLCEKLTRLKHGWVDEIKIFNEGPHITFYHDIFFATSPIDIDGHPEALFKSFMAMMGAFIKSSIKGGSGGEEVLSVTVGGRTVATTDATLTNFDTLNDRFTKYGATPIVDVSGHHFDLIVDFARRCRLSPDGAVVAPPTCCCQDKLLRVSDMYGVLDAMYPNILANDVMQTLLDRLGKKEPTMLCVFKSALHGHLYESMMRRVAGRRGLLFVIKCSDTHTIAAFVDTKLQLPADPASELQFWCPVSLFSVSGAFEEGITEIDVPKDYQRVSVAGTKGGVTDRWGKPCGKMCIARGLWLGHGERHPTYNFCLHRPTDDIRLCHQWVKQEELPANKKFAGQTIRGSGGHAALLSGSETTCFTAQRVEVFQVWDAMPADPILCESCLRALVDATGMTDATPHLLYKGEADGFEHEALLEHVGSCCCSKKQQQVATDLLLLLKDLDGPIIACHIEGGLTPPADPTAVAKTSCAVSLYSVCGAFDGDGITKIDLSNAEQCICVAGAQAGVKNLQDEPVGKVCIGDMTDGASGRLWLGFQPDAPDPTISRCRHWVLKDCLPADKKYLGAIYFEDRASLGSSNEFTLADLEVYTLQPSAGWQWVSAVASMMLARST